MMEIGQRGEMSMEDEAHLKRSVVKGHWGLAKDKASIHAGMEKVQSYEEAFTQIQRATQISDIDALVRQFIENEDQNFKVGIPYASSPEALPPPPDPHPRPRAHPRLTLPLTLVPTLVLTLVPTLVLTPHPSPSRSPLTPYPRAHPSPLTLVLTPHPSPLTRLALTLTSHLSPSPFTQMFNYLNELNMEIERGEEQLAELKQETEKYRGQDKGAASQRKRLIKDLQERTVDVESKTVQYEDAFKSLTSSISQVSTCMHARTHARMHARTHAYACTRARTHARMHACMHADCQVDRGPLVQAALPDSATLRDGTWPP